MRLFKFALPIVSLMLVGGFLAALYQSQAQPEVVWGKQWGTVASEAPHDITLNGDGSIYVSGMTKGNLFGQNQGGMDIFIMKLDSSGQVLWSKQFGTKDNDEGAKLSGDATRGIYLVTVTTGEWFGESLDDRDVVLLKLSTDGQPVQGRRIGTDKGEARGRIVVDQQGYIYVTGVTDGSLFGQHQRGEFEGGYEGFLAKLDSAGNLVWGKQFKDDLPEEIAIDSQGNIYVIGKTYDINNIMVTFLAKFASNGTLVWRQVLPDTKDEVINSLCIDGSGNVYVVGEVAVYVDENRLVSIPDAFIAKHDGANGQRVWFKRFKSQGEGEIAEAFDDVTVDGQGNVYVVGFAEGSLFGNHLGDADVVLAKFDAQGNMIWGKQWGTDKGDAGIAIVVDGDGNIYLAGSTLGNLFGTNAGGADIFAVKFRQ